MRGNFNVLTRNSCARQFVVDRVAWAGGADLPLEATKASYFPLDSQPQPALTLDQVASTVGVPDGLLTAAVVNPDDLASVEPRWNVAGNDLLWFVRGLAASDSQSSADDPTRAGQEWLVDDATGAVLESGSVALDPGYTPARIWFQATRGSDHLSNELDRRVPAYDVFQVEEQLLHAGHVSGTTHGRPGLITYGPDLPLALEPGTYTIEFWFRTPARTLHSAIPPIGYARPTTPSRHPRTSPCKLISGRVRRARSRTWLRHRQLRDNLAATPAGASWSRDGHAGQDHPAR